MKAFVTGGAGFIGSHLVDRLISQGSHVTVFDNLSSGKMQFIGSHGANSHFHFIQGDLSEIHTLKDVLKNHDTVFHLAANPDARRGIEDSTLDLREETLATYNVLEAMRCNGVKKIVFSSSGTIYGETPVIPLAEGYGPVLPISLYGAGKMASEGLISAFCSTFHMQSWIYRFGNVVGKRATHGVILDFIRKLKNNPLELEILGDGTQSKPYIHVEECIDGIVYGFTNSREQISVNNLGPDTATSVNTIARVVIKELGLDNVTIGYTGGDRGWPGDVPQVRFNIDKMKHLGWQTKLTSDQAVEKAVKEIVEENRVLVEV